jgi:hypothetical protein
MMRVCTSTLLPFKKRTRLGPNWKHPHAADHRTDANMDILKSAVASAIFKGPAFPYTFGDKVGLEGSIWTLHNGVKKV